MGNIRPVYKKLLIIAIALYLIGNCVMLSILFYDVEEIKHTLLHLTGKH
ncbi:MAG: hypothetical protein WBC74_04645 [Candidatus Omnitrophota bacterium]